jgi:hypothetical protein
LPALQLENVNVYFNQPHHHHHGAAEGAQAGNSPFEQQLEAMEQAATNQTTTAADGTTNLVPAPGA